MPSIRNALIEDCPVVAQDMRQEDIDEIKASTGNTPLKALIEGVKTSSHAFTIEHAGKPIAMLGVAPHPLDSTIGVLWLLSTNELTRDHSIWLLRHSQDLFTLDNNHYCMLFNLIDTRNTVHMRWLEWCGFTFGKVHEQFGPEKRPFQEFWRSRCVT